MSSRSNQAVQLTHNPLLELSRIPPLPKPIGLVRRLAEALDAHGVRHCHWKGTFWMASVLAGDKDIDLLVDIDSAAELRRVLKDLGFKPALAPTDHRITGESHYFGYDELSGRIVHMHLHDRIVLGDPKWCTYRLPVEKACLANSGGELSFPVPRVEFEFVLFVLRMTLDQTKPSWRPPLTCLTPTRAREFEYLRANACRAEVDAILRSHLPFVDPTFFHESADALAGDDRPRSRKLSRELSRRLDNSGVCRSGNLLRSSWRHMCRAIQTRVLRCPPRKRHMARGGVTIALVGGDGSGKSTVTAHVREWLAEHFDVAAAHLGKPRRSVTTWVVRGGLKVVHVLRTRLCSKPARVEQSSQRSQLSEALWHFCVARDRYHAYREVRRRVAAGKIVICDRWPLPDVITMDGPRILHEGGEASLSPLIESLGRMEERWLRSIGRPDVLIVLKVAPEISVRRKPEEDPDFVRSRGLEVWNAKWSKTGAHLINAADPLESVLSQVKRLVWKAI